ncbi:VRR-NUC domain containing protein [uncultured Caudovirales phage]|uniref:VRR-NUC domain containing protein n=1 Tax=uncultured Caudovirales phage TaxID=2100421 RepID=A0A6J5SJQ9_9CAUD|nr:VRR-NUC domain containing protein [uncultured Caudovirales phage]
MKESTIEKYLTQRVKDLGGRAYKFTSPMHRGVADRVVCLPDGQTWFVEVKTEGGRLSPLQKVFASDMALMNQKYVCLWNKEQIDGWIITTLPRNGG